MAAIKFCVLCCLIAGVLPFSTAVGQYSSGGGGAGGGGGGLGGGLQPGMPYNFEWVVRAPDFGNDFGHAEESDGDSVQGQYFVLLPDGRRQTVTYTVEGSSGFVADVQYEGEAIFPGGDRGGGRVVVAGGGAGGSYS